MVSSFSKAFFVIRQGYLLYVTRAQSKSERQLELKAMPKMAGMAGMAMEPGGKMAM